MSPTSSELTEVRLTLRAVATYTIEVVTHAASAVRKYSTGLGPSLWPSRMGGSPASRMKDSERVVSSPPAA